MKIYFPEKQDSKIPQIELFTELRAFSEKQGAGLRRDSFLSLTNDRDDQFFLKSAQNFILWGKIFSEPFTFEKGRQLKLERDEMSLKFLQPLKLQVFFRDGEVNEERAELYPEADYFRYSVIQSSVETALVIERVLAPKATLPLPEPAPRESVKRPEYSFLRQSQLTRNELAELIDLSLDLKRT